MFSIIRVVLTLVFMAIDLPISAFIVSRHKEDEPYGKAKGLIYYDPEDWQFIRSIFGDMVWQQCSWLHPNMEFAAEWWYKDLIAGKVSVYYYTDRDGIRHVFKKNTTKDDSVVMENYKMADGIWKPTRQAEINGEFDFKRNTGCEFYQGMIMWKVTPNNYNGR